MVPVILPTCHAWSTAGLAVSISVAHQHVPATQTDLYLLLLRSAHVNVSHSLVRLVVRLVCVLGWVIWSGLLD